MPERTDLPLRWGPLSLTFLIGLGLLIAAILEHVEIQYLLLDIGSAIALAAVIAVLQRTFVRQVQQEGKAVRADIAQQSENIERRFEDQASRIENIEDQVNGVRSRRQAENRESIERARAAPTIENISDALVRALKVNGITSQIRVRSSDQLDGNRFIVEFVDDKRIQDVPGVGFTPTDIEDGCPQRYAMFWALGEGFEDFAERLIESMERDNLPTEKPYFDIAGLMNRIVDTAELAIQSRAGMIAPRIAGRVIEVIDETWVITDEGVHSRELGLVTSWEAFFHYDPADRRPARLVAPPPPLEVNADLWTVITKAVYGGIPRPPHRKGLAATM